MATIDTISGPAGTTASSSAKPTWLGSNWGILLAVAALVAVLWLPTPEGLSIAGQRMLAVLAFAVIVWTTDYFAPRVQRSWRTDGLRGQPLRSVSAGGVFCRQDTEGGAPERLAGRAADQVRARDQSKHREGARHHRTRSAACAGRPGD